MLPCLGPWAMPWVMATLGQAWANASKQYWANMKLPGVVSKDHRSPRRTHFYTYTVNLVTENMELETPENLTWPNFFGTGRISWVIPIIKEKWGYKPPK